MTERQPSNPYASPSQDSEPEDELPGNLLASVSLGLSVVAMVSLFAIGHFPDVSLGVLFAIPGFLTALIARWFRSCQKTKASLLIGGIVCLYVPTVLLSVIG